MIISEELFYMNNLKTCFLPKDVENFDPLKTLTNTYYDNKGNILQNEDNSLKK